MSSGIAMLVLETREPSGDLESSFLHELSALLVAQEHHPMAPVHDEAQSQRRWCSPHQPAHIGHRFDSFSGTHSCLLGTNLFSNMTAGFGRVAANEPPDLRLQQLDIENPLTTDPRTVAEIFLRFYASEYQDDCLLWSLEPEIRIDSRGCQALSRLRPVSELNDRYNSIERTTLHERDIRDSPVVLQSSPHGFSIENLSKWDTSCSEIAADTVDVLDLHISHTTVHAIRTPFGHRSLGLGARTADGAFLLALVPSMASNLKVPASLAVSIEVARGSEQNALAMVTANLVASTILDSLYHGQTVLIHNAEKSIDMALIAQTAIKDIKVVFTSNPAQGGAAPLSSLRLPEFAIQRDLEELLPEDHDVFVDFEIGKTLPLTIILA